MMMEAIRLSLAAEDERKRKEEKEAMKEAKKDEKKKPMKTLMENFGKKGEPAKPGLKGDKKRR